MEKMDVSSSKSGTFPCELCEVICTNKQIYEGHLMGSKHQKKVKRQELERLWELKDPSCFCSVCELALEPLLMDMHLNGSKHKSMTGKGSETVQKQQSASAKALKKINQQQSQISKKKPAAKGTISVINCTLCSVVLTSMSLANDHFNSKAHERKCARKYLEEKKIDQTNPENRHYCDTCDLTVNGEDTFNAHLQGFKHNYKLMKGNFDPKSPFAAKSMRLKEKVAELKMRRKKQSNSDGKQ